MNPAYVIRYMQRLISNMTREGPAYGFTLTIWGTGVLAVKHFGIAEIIYLIIKQPLVALPIASLLATLTYNLVLTARQLLFPDRMDEE